MKVVILAAGKGSRLGDPSLPKPLTRLINGKSILENQLEILQRFLSLDQIIIVVGYHKEEIMERFPGLLYVYNQNFADENTAKSLLKALNKIDEDVLWLNGDVVMDASVIELVLKTSKTSMVVNSGNVGEEEVKYRLDDNGNILEISKNVINPQGEAVGINYWEGKDLKTFCKNLGCCLDTDYFEKGIELCIEQGMAVRAITIAFNLCTEIDFPEDLKKANQMLLEWGV